MPERITNQPQAFAFDNSRQHWVI